MMAIPHCTNFAADQTLACCSLVAEGLQRAGLNQLLVEIVVELAADSTETSGLGRLHAETHVVKGRKLAVFTQGQAKGQAKAWAKKWP